ncbi:MAG: T9SS type A sorting domain-containing protein [Bacteroidales bacterium]
MKHINTYLLFLFLSFLTYSAYSQVDRGGVPRSFRLLQSQKSVLPKMQVVPPDMLKLTEQDIADARLEKAYRVGTELPVSVTMENAGQWDFLPNGGRIWRLTLQCKDALGIGLNFKAMQLPAGSDLFVYTSDHTSILGAYTSNEVLKNNTFTTRPVYGDEITLEYFEAETVGQKAAIEISGLVYMYRNFDKPVTTNSSTLAADTCEVNINCTEGLNWQEQKQGVVKIYSKVGQSYFWCTGTLLNNTRQDFANLLLTAAHCSKSSGVPATADDMSQWIFYFNYEAPTCITSAASNLTVLGAEKLAASDNPNDVGSDFLLLKLLTEIPSQYRPYYCGWDANNDISTSGVCIHHPNGQVKKISTYTAPPTSSTWESTPNTHWVVKWAATSSGYTGVTERGSSGSALFDNEGLVIGSLTGGESGCSDKSGLDKYGKVQFSWQSNGSSASQQLKPWLDPTNTGKTKMPGSFNENYTHANFSASSEVVPVGGSLNFQDLSSGHPTSWHWFFEGGTPSESTEQNPLGIRFDRNGKMNIKLIVENYLNTDTLVKDEYIDVKAVVSPNPTSTGEVNIFSDILSTNDILIDVFDPQGKIAQHFEFPGATSTNNTIKLPAFGTIFIIRVTQGDQVQVHKVIVADGM